MYSILNTLTNSFYSRKEWTKPAVKTPKTTVEDWIYFNDKLQREGQDKVLTPYYLIPILIQKYLPQISSDHPILDVGCETGKNAISLTAAGHKVVLLDIAPNAIAHTSVNLARLNLLQHVAGTIVSPIESLDPKQDRFKAVVGTYAFSFIPPHLFHEVMRKNVLARIEPGGYFAGGFFGHQHAWASNPHLSFVTPKELRLLFRSAQFRICMMEEKREYRPSLRGRIPFHTIHVIAQKEKI